MSMFQHTHIPVAEPDAVDNSVQIDHYIIKGDPAGPNEYNYTLEIHLKPNCKYHSCIKLMTTPEFSRRLLIFTYADPTPSEVVATEVLGLAGFIEGVGPEDNFEFTTYEADNLTEVQFIKNTLDLNLSATVPKKKRKQHVNFTVNPNSNNSRQFWSKIWKKLFDFLRGLFKKKH